MPFAVDELGQGVRQDWLTAADCAPEFAREIFGRAEIGVLPRLVHSRFGLHIVEIVERETPTSGNKIGFFEQILGNLGALGGLGGGNQF